MSFETESPKVSYTVPQDGGMVSLTGEIRFIFNTVMDKDKTKKAFSISPEVPVRFDWGTQNNYDVLAIRPSSSFVASQTYVATIDTFACDITNNQLKEKFSLIFSTK